MGGERSLFIGELNPQEQERGKKCLNGQLSKSTKISKAKVPPWGEGLALYLFKWLAMCLFAMSLVDVEESWK